ncbi:MAG: hypothetical protein JO069_16175, partial [Verrucomicrobia bacterium]|nr:hypothetical protein [Verrucomicrobiota bacterium]
MNLMTGQTARDRLGVMVVPDRSPLPEHVVTVPLRPEDVDAPVGLGLILARDQSGDAALVLLRQTLGTSIFLGCLRDRDGLPLEFYEIWVQNAANLRASFRAQLQRMTNGLLDRTWHERWRVRRQVNGTSIPRTGWEEVGVPPLLVDRVQGTSAHVREPASGHVLVLCTDESALRAAGLPGYRDSLFRFLWNQDSSEPRFYSLVTDPASSQPNVNDLSAGLDPKTVFNPEGGRLLVFPYAPFALAEYSDLIAGKPWSGAHPQVDAWLPEQFRALADADALAHGDSLFLHSRFGPLERALEILLLKVNLLTQAVCRVEAQTRILQRPFMRLDQESFRVHLSAPGSGLPLFWNGRVELVAENLAERVTLGTTEFPYFLPPDAFTPSVYQPKSTPVYRRSAGAVRIRELLPTADGKIAVDLTFATDEDLRATGSDLIHLTLLAGGSSLDVYGHPDKPRGLAEHEV